MTYRELLTDVTDYVLRSEAQPQPLVDEHLHRPLASYRLGMRPSVEGSESSCIDCWAWIRFDGRLWVMVRSLDQMQADLLDLAT